MNNSPKAKSSPKTVKIALQSPQKKAKQQSPPRTKEPFNQSLSKLKKTFNTNPNIYTYIQANHQDRIAQHEQSKKKMKDFEQEEIDDSQNRPELTRRQLQVCRQLFMQLDKDKKQYIVTQDLPNIREKRICDIVKVIFVRKERNSFFDFLYGLWDSGAMGLLTK